MFTVQFTRDVSSLQFHEVKLVDGRFSRLQVGVVLGDVMAANNPQDARPHNEESWHSGVDYVGPVGDVTSEWHVLPS